MAEKKNLRVQAEPARRQQADQGSTVPLVDVYEVDDGTTILEAELPGAASDSIDIRVDKGVLTLEAEANPAPAGEDYAATYTGFAVGRYFRAFALSDEIDRDRIEASLADGVLTLRLPKAAAARTRKIEIKES